jgi:plasmid maintenance system antidote protein VapI
VTAAQFQAAIQALGIVPAHHARTVLGISPNHVSRIIQGHRQVTPTVALLLAALLKLQAHGVPANTGGEK